MRRWRDAESTRSGPAQQLDDGVLSTLFGMRQRTHALAVGEVDVGAVIDQ